MYYRVFQYANGWQKATKVHRDINAAWEAYQAAFGESLHPIAVISVKGALELYADAPEFYHLEYYRDASPDLLNKLLKPPKPKPVQLKLFDMGIEPSKKHPKIYVVDMQNNVTLDKEWESYYARTK